MDFPHAPYGLLHRGLQRHHCWRCGAAAHAYLGLGRLHAAAVAAAIMIALTLLQATGGRIRRRSVLARQLADLSRGSADVARQVAEIHGRLAALEEKVDTALDHSRAVTDPLALEIGELGTLVKQLAETVANQQTVFEAHLQRAAAGRSCECADAAESPLAVAPGEAPHPSDTRGPDLDTSAMRSKLIGSKFISNRSSRYPSARCVSTKLRRDCARLPGDRAPIRFCAAR